MKTTILGASLLRTLLGAAALFACTSAVQAANPFVAGSKWTGLSVSASNGAVANAGLLVTNNPTVGQLSLLGQTFPVSIAYNANGVVDLQGLGGAWVNYKVHGSVAPQGGTYTLTASYSINLVTGLPAQGRLRLIRVYNKGTATPGVVIGTNPGEGLLPPGPCTGAFLRTSGFQGRMVLEHALPTQTSEADPPSEFGGDIYMQDFHFRSVGTINPQANADGSHNIEMIGENLDPTNPFQSFASAGLLLPAVRTTPVGILGNYELIGLLRNTIPVSDRGTFKISQ